MMRREAAPLEPTSSSEKSRRTYLFLTKAMGIIIGAIGLIFFLFTFNLAILIVLVIIGAILFVIGNGPRSRTP